MIQFGIRRDGKDQMRLMRRDMEQMDRRLQQNRKLFAVIRDDVLIPNFESKFRAGGAYGQPRWQPITTQTLKRRKKRNNNWAYLHKPLIDTGWLQEAALAKSRFAVRGNEMTYGKWPHRRWWAPIHDFGGREIPERPWARLTPNDIRGIDEVREDWVRGIILDNWERGRGRSTWFASM